MASQNSDAIITIDDTPYEDIDLSKDEQEALISAFKKLGTKPKLSSPEDLRNWMANYVADTVKPEVRQHHNVYATSPNQWTTTSANTHSSIPVSTTSHGTMNYTPRISTFFGELGKGEAPYDLWKYEVDTLGRSQFPSHIVDMAVRRSLKGDAARIAMRLGADTNIETLLHKLESAYGISIQDDLLMREFYDAQQKTDEDVTTWANRIEDLLYKACQKNVVRREEMNEKLCSRFWSGLSQHLQDTSGHLHYIVKDFDTLKKEMRDHETNIRRTVTTATTKMMTPKTQSTNEDIRATIQQMAADIQELKQNRQFNTHSSEDTHRNWRGRGQASITSKNNFTRHDQRYNTTPTNRHGQNNTHSTYPNIRHQGHQSTYNRDEDRLPRCYRCGQTGHIQIGCRARLDHSRTAGLNFKRPT